MHVCVCVWIEDRKEGRGWFGSVRLGLDLLDIFERESEWERIGEKLVWSSRDSLRLITWWWFGQMVVLLMAEAVRWLQTLAIQSSLQLNSILSPSCRRHIAGCTTSRSLLSAVVVAVGLMLWQCGRSLSAQDQHRSS